MMIKLKKNQKLKSIKTCNISGVNQLKSNDLNASESYSQPGFNEIA